MEITMNSMRLFAMASALSATAAFVSVANAEPGVDVRAGGVSIGIGVASSAT
jgi:hypothetical protein